MLLHKNIILVGIIGQSASGKTAVSRMLAESYQLSGNPVTLISADRFYFSEQELKKDNIDIDDPKAFAADELSQCLTSLKRGYPTRFPALDFTTDFKQRKYEVILPKTVILVEGVLLMHFESIRKLLDICIYIESSEGTCFTRRLIRDVNERSFTASRVMNRRGRVTATFKKAVQPYKNKCHYILNNDKSNNIQESIIALKYYLDLNVTYRSVKNNQLMFTSKRTQNKHEQYKARRNGTAYRAKL